MGIFQLGIFKQKWQDYEVATGLDEKVSNVLFRCGSGEDTISSPLKALKDYSLPKRNVVYERYVFNSCCQTPDETVGCFVNRLRKLTSSCQYGALTQYIVRDRLVICIQDKNTKARLLRERALSLDKALDMCKSSEVTNQQLKSIQNNERKDNYELNFVRDTRRLGHGKKPPNQKKPPSQKKPANKSSTASTVVSKRSMLSRLIVQHTNRNVEFVRK